MKIEDIREGMWLRSRANHIIQARVQMETRREFTAWWPEYAAEGFIVPAMATELEPWTPRVGDWVRPRGHHPAVVVDWLPKVGFKGCVLVEYPDGVGESTGGPVHVAIDDVEPCAAPSPKPELRALYDGPDGAEAVRASAVLRDAALPAERPRDHNATCKRCGGRAYQGIGMAKCVEPVCDGPETRMPDEVREVAMFRQGWAGDETGWSAEGRGVYKTHPTKDGAIQAWREAVERRACLAMALALLL